MKKRGKKSTINKESLSRDHRIHEGKCIQNIPVVQIPKCIQEKRGNSGLQCIINEIVFEVNQLEQRECPTE